MKSSEVALSPHSREVPLIRVGAVLPGFGPLKWTSKVPSSAGNFFLRVGIMVLSLYISNSVLTHANEAIRYGIVIPGCYILLWIAWYKGAERALAWSVRRKQNLEPGTIIAEVSYTDGVWKYENSYTWDRGGLMIQGGVLSFAGYVSDFVLPLTAIHQVEVVRYLAWRPLFQHRVLIRWTYEGESGVLGLDVIGGRATAEALAQVIRLADRTETDELVRLPWHLPEAELRRLSPSAIRRSEWLWTAGLAVFASWAMFVGLAILMAHVLLLHQIEFIQILPKGLPTALAVGWVLYSIKQKLRRDELVTESLESLVS